LDLGSGYFGSANTSLRVGMFGCNATPAKVNFVAKVVGEAVTHFSGGRLRSGGMFQPEIGY